MKYNRYEIYKYKDKSSKEQWKFLKQSNYVYVVLEHHFTYSAKFAGKYNSIETCMEDVDARIHGVYKKRSSAEEKAKKLGQRFLGGYICVLKQRVRDLLKQ